MPKKFVFELLSLFNLIFPLLAIDGLAQFLKVTLHPRP